jgi:hypothetical protein
MSKQSDMSFNSDTIQALKFYVYLLSDPDSGEVFYVGKGKGNRVFQHLKEKENSAKSRKISEIIDSGKEPKIEILVHGIEDERTAMKIEAAIIDLLDKSNLTNRVSGYESADFGRMDLNQVKAKYGRKKAIISEKVVLIKLSDTFRYNMSEVELYDHTRGIWKIGKRGMLETTHAFAVYDGVVQETYKISGWFPAGSTLHTRNDKANWLVSERYEFVGRVDEEMQKKYKHKSVDHYFKAGSRNPIRYTFDVMASGQVGKYAPRVSN